MKNILLSLFLSCLGIVAFSQEPSANSTDEPAIIQVAEDDKEMNDAIEKAKKTLNKFRSAISSNNGDLSSFSLKARFETPEGVEHIWVSGISIKNNEYYGTVSNVPANIPSIKEGDLIKVPKEIISDWMYVDSVKLVGGYTLRLLRKRMTEKERKAFDAQTGLIIED